MYGGSENYITENKKKTHKRTRCTHTQKTRRRHLFN